MLIPNVQLLDALQPAAVNVSILLASLTFRGELIVSWHGNASRTTLLFTRYGLPLPRSSTLSASPPGILAMRRKSVSLSCGSL